MSKDSPGYKVIPTRACIEYIERNGLTIQDNSDYGIKSSSGLIYLLPNNEVVLIPANFDLNYPGIVFENLEIFRHYADLNFFPIGEENMTWFERYNNQIKQFRTHSEFYSKTLTQVLHVQFPFQNSDDIKEAFLKVREILHSGKQEIGLRKAEQLVYSFGLALTNYLVDIKKLKPVYRESYENYNPVTNVLIEEDGEVDNILTTCSIYIRSTSPDSLASFMKVIGL
jgi:hypothetical protein